MEYVYEEDFSSAFFAAHRIQLDNANILVDFMREQTVPGWIPRRLGGGVGGRKQSGQMRFGGRDCPFRAPFDITLYQSRTKDKGLMSSITTPTDRGSTSYNSSKNGNKSTYSEDDRHSRNGNLHSHQSYEQRRDHRREDKQGNTGMNRNERSVVDQQQTLESTRNGGERRRDSMDDEYAKRKRRDHSYSSNRSHSSHHTHHRSSRSRSRSRDYHHSYHSSHHHSHSSSHHHYHCLFEIKISFKHL